MCIYAARKGGPLIDGVKEGGRLGLVPCESGSIFEYFDMNFRLLGEKNYSFGSSPSQIMFITGECGQSYSQSIKDVNLEFWNYIITKKQVSAQLLKGNT